MKREARERQFCAVSSWRCEEGGSNWPAAAGRQSLSYSVLSLRGALLGLCLDLATGSFGKSCRKGILVGVRWRFVYTAVVLKHRHQALICMGNRGICQEARTVAGSAAEADLIQTNNPHSVQGCACCLPLVRTMLNTSGQGNLEWRSSLVLYTLGTVQILCMQSNDNMSLYRTNDGSSVLNIR